MNEYFLMALWFLGFIFAPMCIIMLYEWWKYEEEKKLKVCIRRNSLIQCGIIKPKLIWWRE